MIHQFNILLHVLAGILALMVGMAALLVPKYTPRHKRLGRLFLYLLAMVVTSGFLGWLFFRSSPFLLMLTLLSGYVGYAGWRTVRLRTQRSSIWDVMVALIALSLGVLFLVQQEKNDANWNPVVMYSTLGALILVTTYDIVKHLLLHRYLNMWWIYEHIYKMVSAFSAIFSAFAGTVLPAYKPWSQIMPSTFCVMLIVVLIWRQAVKERKGNLGKVSG